MEENYARKIIREEIRLLRPNLTKNVFTDRHAMSSLNVTDIYS